MIRQKAASYALLAVCEIARRQRNDGPDQGIQVRDIARKHRLPAAYAAKLLSLLAKAGVLRSDRGPNGGFRLNRPVDKITVYDLLDAAGALTVGGGDPAPELPGALESILNQARQEGARGVKEVLRRSTIADLV